MKEGAILARFLNLASAEPLLRSEGHAVEQVASQLTALTEDAFRRRVKLSSEEIARRRAEREKKLEQFNALLRPHTWELQLVGWSDKGTPVFCDLPSSGTGAEMFILIQLARAQLLDRLRKCAKCGTWFFARRPRAKFCSTSCRKAEFRSTEEFQKQNEKYQKKYYRNKLSPNQEYYQKGLEPAEIRELKRKRKNRVKGKHGKR
jgi:hypothetical protein